VTAIVEGGFGSPFSPFLGPPFSPFIDTILTLNQCYARYESLLRQEEMLSEQGKSLNNSDGRELLALTKLIERDQTRILSGLEKVVISVNAYYYVKFGEGRVSDFKDIVRNYLAISSFSGMMKAFGETSWYKKRTVSHTTADYVDMLHMLSSVHRCTMSTLQVLQFSRNIHGDLRGFALSLKFITGIYDQYASQKQLNDACNEQVIQLIQQYALLLHNPQQFLDTIPSLENRAITNLAVLECAFLVRCSLIKTLVRSLFDQTARCLPHAEEPSFMVTLHVKSSEQKITPRYLNDKIHITYALSSMVTVLQQIEWCWKRKFVALSRQLACFNRSSIKLSDEQVLWTRSVDQLSLLHTICLQNMLLNKKMCQHSEQAKRVYSQLYTQRDSKLGRQDA